MKKIVFVLLIAVVLGGCSTIKNNNLSIVTVGGNKIIFPAPNNQFKEVGFVNRSKFKKFVPEDNSLLCVYLDSSDYCKLIIGQNGNGQADKYILIEVINEYNSTDLSVEDFADVKKKVNSELTIEINDVMEAGNKILKEKLENIPDIDIRKPKYLGTIYDTKDSYGILISNNITANTIIKKKLLVNNILRINNRLIFIFIYSNFDDISDVKWITDLSKSWTKAIIEANK